MDQAKPNAITAAKKELIAKNAAILNANAYVKGLTVTPPEILRKNTSADNKIGIIYIRIHSI